MEFFLAKHANSTLKNCVDLDYENMGIML